MFSHQMVSVKGVVALVAARMVVKFACASAKRAARTSATINPLLDMPFTKLLNADVGMVLLPMLNLKVALLCFMPLCKRCKDLTRCKLLKQGNTTLSRDSAVELRTILDCARMTTACADLAGLPKRLTELLFKSNSLAPVYDLSIAHYGFQLDDAMFRYWNQLPMSPRVGVSQAVLQYITTKRADELLVGYTEDTQYWGTSGAFGEFIILFDRIDGTVLVSKDCTKVYLLCKSADNMPSSTFGKLMAMLRKDLRADVRDIVLPLPTLHGAVQALRVHGQLLNWNGVIVPVQQNGIWWQEKMRLEDSSAELRCALRAYQHAVDTSTLITSLPKIPPPDAAAVPTPVLPAGGVEQYRAEHADFLRSICGQPKQEGSFFAKWTVRLLSQSPLTLCIEFGDGSRSQCWKIPGNPSVASVNDYLQLLALTADGCNGRPKIISVDTAAVFYDLKILLEYHHFFVHFEVPPLPGEQRARTPLCCARCGETKSLLCCGGCGLVHYCSKEHQKSHWTHHKRFCQQYKL